MIKDEIVIVDNKIQGKIRFPKANSEIQSMSTISVALYLVYFSKYICPISASNHYSVYYIF